MLKISKIRKRFGTVLLALAVVFLAALTTLGTASPIVAAGPTSTDTTRACQVITKLLAEQRPDLVEVYQLYVSQDTGDGGDTGTGDTGGDTTGGDTTGDPEPVNPCPNCPPDCPSACAVSHLPQTIQILEAFQRGVLAGQRETLAAQRERLIAPRLNS